MTDSNGTRIFLAEYAFSRNDTNAESRDRKTSEKMLRRPGGASLYLVSSDYDALTQDPEVKSFLEGKGWEFEEKAREYTFREFKPEFLDALKDVVRQLAEEDPTDSTTWVNWNEKVTIATPSSMGASTHKARRLVLEEFFATWGLKVGAGLTVSCHYKFPANECALVRPAEMVEAHDQIATPRRVLEVDSL